jgi:hypothetical protein
MQPNILQKFLDVKCSAGSFPRVHLCHVVQMKDPINYDIHFLSTNPVDDRKSAVISSVCSYKIVNPETLERTEPITARLYRARLAGIISIDSPAILFPTEKYITGESIRKRRTFEHKWRFNMANMHMVRWNYITGGVFGCIIRGVDIHRRLLIDLIDVVTAINVREYLLEIYPDIYQVYSRPDENAEIDDMRIEESSALDNSVSGIYSSNE